MALLSIIRRWHLRDHVSLREIAKRLGISRNTVRRYLRSGTIEPTYSRAAGPTVLDGYAEKLSAWLKAETNRTRKQRRSLLQLHQDLCALGYTGSYDRVAAFARRWRQEQQERSQTSGWGTFVPLAFAPGDAFQFDWSEDSAVINGERTKLQIAQFKLCHSRAFFLRAYWLQTHEMLFDAHHHAFVAWGGIPRRGIYDSMKTAVDRVGRGKSREVNARFSSMVSHYLFDAQFCNPASGWEKGQIEKSVQESRRRIWQRLPHFSSLEALNDWLADECVRLWQQIRHPACDQSIWQIWSEERPFLMPVGQPFDGFVCTFQAETKSMPESRPAMLTLTPEQRVRAGQVGQVNRLLAAWQQRGASLPGDAADRQHRRLAHPLVNRLDGPDRAAFALATACLADSFAQDRHWQDVVRDLPRRGMLEDTLRHLPRQAWTDHLVATAAQPEPHA